MNYSILSIKQRVPRTFHFITRWYNYVRDGTSDTGTYWKINPIISRRDGITTGYRTYPTDKYHNSYRNRTRKTSTISTFLIFTIISCKRFSHFLVMRSYTNYAIMIRVVIQYQSYIETKIHNQSTVIVIIVSMGSIGSRLRCSTCSILSMIWIHSSTYL